MLQNLAPRLVHCARALTTQALVGPWTRHVSRPAQNGPNDTASPWSSTFTARTMPCAARPIGSESVPLLASTDLHTRASLRLLACTYHNQKCWDTKETLRLMQLVVAGHREAEGGAHPGTAAALADCGQLLSLDGQGVAAIATLREALATYRCALGHSHPATLKCMVNLGRELERSAFVEEALLLYQEVLAERSVMLGSTHEDTLEISHCVAALLEHTGKLGETLHLYQQNAALCLAKFGADDQRTLSSVNTLCDHLFEHGPRDKATRVEVRKAMQEVLARKRALHNHPNQTQSVRRAMELLYRLHFADSDLAWHDHDEAGKLLNQWEALENTSGNPESAKRIRQSAIVGERSAHRYLATGACVITTCLFGICTVVGYEHYLLHLAIRSVRGMGNVIEQHILSRKALGSKNLY